MWTYTYGNYYSHFKNVPIVVPKCFIMWLTCVPLPAHIVLHLSSLPLHQSFPTFQTPLTPLGDSNPESHFHSQTLGNQSHQERSIHSLTLRHALEVQRLFFFKNPPIYWNTLWGTFITVGRACKGSGNGIANVRYQMIFIASSPRAISTLCQHRRFILEAICTWLNCSAQSSIVTAFNAK